MKYAENEFVDSICSIIESGKFTGGNRCCVNDLGVPNVKVDVACGRIFAGTVAFRLAGRIFELNFSGVAVLICAFLLVLDTLDVVSMKSVLVSLGSAESASTFASVVLCLLCSDGNNLIFGRSIFLYFNGARRVDGFTIDDGSVVCFVRPTSDGFCGGFLNFGAPIKQTIKFSSNEIEQPNSFIN